MLPLSFRNGIYLGLALALVIATCLHFLWQPGRQVRLHSVHFLQAIELKSWGRVGEFVDDRYHDQWGQDRELLRSHLRDVLRSLRNLRIHSQELTVRAGNNRGEWRAWIAVEADPNEVSAFVKERVNGLATPFELQWQQQSGKPWDWKLVAVTNAGLELPPDGY